MIRNFFLCISLIASSQAFANKAAPIEKFYPLDEVAPDVFVVHGPTEAPNQVNQGFINNPSFIITDEGVVVIDPGSSVQVGEMLMAHIDGKTKLPVVAVFNTHVHGDHWLGNEAVVAKYPDAKIYAHPMTSRMIKQGEDVVWLDFMENLTAGATAGTRALGPTHLVNGGDEISIGNLSFKVFHTGEAHTATDIMIYVKERSVIYLSDNASQNFVVPVEGSMRGNIQALDDAIKSGAKVFIPGHGKTSGPKAASDYRDFLSIIYETAKTGYEEGLADFEIRPQLLPKLEQWESWSGFEGQIGKLLNFAYLEAELAAF